MLLAVAFPLCGCAGLISIFTSDHRDWTFIQSVGGLFVGNPKHLESDNWYLPIDCDVSGIRTITIKPTTVNSALVVRKIKTKVKLNTVQIWVITSVADKQNISSSSTGVTLKGITEGSYKIEYLNPDGTTISIKTVEFKTK